MCPGRGREDGGSFRRMQSLFSRSDPVFARGRCVLGIKRARSRSSPPFETFDSTRRVPAHRAGSPFADGERALFRGFLGGLFGSLLCRSGLLRGLGGLLGYLLRGFLSSLLGRGLLRRFLGGLLGYGFLGHGLLGGLLRCLLCR